MIDFWTVLNILIKNIFSLHTNLAWTPSVISPSRTAAISLVISSLLASDFTMISLVSKRSLSDKLSWLSSRELWNKLIQVVRLQVTHQAPANRWSLFSCIFRTKDITCEKNWPPSRSGSGGSIAFNFKISIFGVLWVDLTLSDYFVWSWEKFLEKLNLTELLLLFWPWPWIAVSRPFNFVKN